MIIYSPEEDYLKAIPILQKEKGKVLSIDLSVHLGVFKLSINNAVKLLSKGSFLTKDSEHFLYLTELG